MNLDEYIEAVEDCENLKDLQNELGVHDNYRILLNAEFDDVLDLFIDSEYKFSGLNENTFIYRHPNENSILYVTDGINMGVTSGMNCIFKKEILKESETQMKDYNVSIIIADIPFDGKPEIAQLYLKQAILDVLKFAAEENMPLCLPDSTGHEHLYDVSRIVYYKPEGANK